MMKDFKFDLHIHTNFSDGIATPEEVIEHAKAIGLAGVSITDHDTMDGYFHVKDSIDDPGIIIIPGVEITTPFGDILAYGVEEMPDGTPTQIIDRIHELGGIAVLAHPAFGGFSQMGFLDMLDIMKHKFDAIEIYNASTPLELNIKAMEAAKNHNMIGIGGSDAHVVEMVGTSYTVSQEKDILSAIKKGNVKVAWI